MCGIAGIVHLDGQNVEQKRLEAMAEAMRHRGPDTQGFFGIDTPVGLAHRRLAIIDLNMGNQPMASRDGSIEVVFNGEIYNYQHIRDALITKGYCFDTNSDTEVLIYAYEEWGISMLEYLNGMFAFALYDLKNHKLFIVRDRLGVKPLYYFFSGQILVFASEMSALLKSGLVPKIIDQAALDLYLHYQYIPAPLTIYQQVKKLSAAECMELNLVTGNHVLWEYWTIKGQSAENEKKEIEDWLAELESLLDDAVAIRLTSDVPFGAFLSGGTDSGLVVALMAKKLGRGFQTFSIGISGQDQVDELPFARQVAQKYGTNHEEFMVSSRDLALLPRLSRFFGEPFADSSAIPTFLISQLAASKVKMVLTGDGGDEFFAGYLTYSNLMRTLDTTFNSTFKGSLARLGRVFNNSFPLSYVNARGFYRAICRQTISPEYRTTETWKKRYDDSMCHFTYVERQKLLTDRSFFISAEDYFLRRFPFPGATDVITQAQFCDVKSYLSGDILVKLDRMSMAHSIEARSPLLDYRIAELAFRIPLRFKIAEPVADGTKNKLILKELASTYLGKEYVYRKKEGFGIPIDRWLQEDQMGIVRDTLMGQGSPIFDYLDKSTVQHLVKMHLSGRKKLGAKIWNLVVFNSWLEEIHADSCT